MTATVLSLVAVVAALAAVIAAALAWQQHRTVAHLQALLVHNEQSRRALAEQLVALREQLEAFQGGPDARSDAEQRRDELERLLAASAVADGPWQDTMPSVLMEFAATEPATITEPRRG